MFSLIVHMFVNVNEDGIATVLLHFVSINHTHSLLVIYASTAAFNASVHFVYLQLG